MTKKTSLKLTNEEYDKTEADMLVEQEFYI
jgi:hypothetical protein